MYTLIIENFSVIKRANVQIKDVTILIGPQASGKSVISKLIYFFIELLDPRTYINLEVKSIFDLNRAVKNDFCDKFPISTWAKGEFSITFKAHSFEVSIARKKQSNGAYKFFVKFSQELAKIFRNCISQVKKASEEINEDNIDSFFITMISE